MIVKTLISRVPIKKIFLSFGLSAKDVLSNNLFSFENKIFSNLPALERANAHLLHVLKLCDIYICSIPTDLN